MLGNIRRSFDEQGLFALLAPVGGAAWDGKRLQEALALLNKIADALDGTLLQDVPLEDAEVAAYRKYRVEAFLDAFARSHADRRWTGAAVYLAPDEKRAPPRGLDELRPHAFHEKVRINFATQDELDALPGMGKKTAGNLLANLPVRSAGSLDAVPGIGPKTIDALAPMLDFSDNQDAGSLSKTAAEFQARPTFANLMKVKLLESAAAGHREGAACVIAELKRALDLVAARAPMSRRRRPYLKASEVLKWLIMRKRARKILEDRGTKAHAYGALIADGKYLPFVKDLLSVAERSIHITMFFMRYEDEKNYPSQELVDSLIRAKKKGLDVRVILDTDEEGDAAGARFINEAVLRKFRDSGVDALTDDPRRKTHSKLVIIDGERVLVGSHNWTAGSFYSYDDTSIFLESKELGGKYVRIFEALWKDYDTTALQGPPRIVVTSESRSGMNLVFKDTKTGSVMSRSEFVSAIRDGKYPDFYVRTVDGVLIPSSKPNSKRSDNPSGQV